MLFAATLSAQLSDIARIDYTHIPAGKSDKEYTRYRALFNYPIKLKEDAFLFLGLDYSKIELSFNKEVPAFDQTQLEDFKLLDFNIGYTFKLNTDWRFGARVTPGFSSNLSAKAIRLDDVVFSTDVVFIKDKKDDPTVKKPYRLIIGVSYAQNRGIPFPIPFVSYYRKFHRKWSYNIGVPRSNLQYHISERSRLKWFAQLDGFTSNIQEGLLVNGIDEANRFRISVIVSGLQYEFKLARHLEFFANAAHIFRNSVQLRDRNQNTISTLDNNNSVYIRSGIRFKI